MKSLTTCLHGFSECVRGVHQPVIQEQPQEGAEAAPDAGVGADLRKGAAPVADTKLASLSEAVAKQCAMAAETFQVIPAFELSRLDEIWVEKEGIDQG